MVAYWAARLAGHLAENWVAWRVAPLAVKWAVKKVVQSAVDLDVLKAEYLADS